MERVQNGLNAPHIHKNTIGAPGLKATREIMSTELCSTMLRPAPTGQDSSDVEWPPEVPSESTKGDIYKPTTSQLTPRRFTAREIPANREILHSNSDEEKLAPLGFEPEGRAVSSPTFYERWANSFTDLINDCEGQNLFYQYLNREGASALVEFHHDCESYRRMAPTSPQMRSTAKTVFQKFVYPRPLCESLGITDATRTQIAHQVNDQPCEPAIFDEAYSEVLENMKTCHYAAFLNSNLYKEYTHSGAKGEPDSLKLGERTLQIANRFHSGYLPTLPEEKVLGFGDETEEEQFELEQEPCKNTMGFPYSANRSELDELDARKLLHAPVKEMMSQYYFPNAPLASRTESENQSLSSDALTDDTMSITTTEGGMTDTSDGYSVPRCSSRRRGASNRSRSRGGLPHFPFVPRSHRMPKEAKNPLHPEEFAKILISKLEKVQIERELLEREAVNLSGHLEDDQCSFLSKKSILQEAIENKQRRDRIPISTMAMSALPSMQDDAASLSTSNQGSSSSKSTSAQATAGSTLRDSSSSGSTHRRSKHTHHSSKSSKHEAEPVEKAPEPQPAAPAPAPQQIKDSSRASTKSGTTAKPDDNIPYITLNHHRIMAWMETGEEELRQVKVPKVRHQSPSSSSSRGSSKSRQSSSSKNSDHYTHHMPNQPIAQDPLMPPLPQPEPITVLGEVRRRLIESKEHDKRSRHSQKHRSRTSVDDVGDSVSTFQEKVGSSSCCCSATECSSCSQSMLSYDIHRPAPSCVASSTLSSFPSSASNIPSDTKSKSDSGISGTTTRKKEKHNASTIIYWLWGEPIAYRTSLPGKRITLGQFKTLIMRKGEFRYFFKTKTEDRDCEVVYEEVKSDKAELPTYEGKIVGKVEKVDS